MKERVAVVLGPEPIIFVCPHGHILDDTHTDFVVEAAAAKLGAGAIINRGWKRSSQVDVLLSNANCNNVRHCKEDVVREEFRDPLQDMIQDIHKYSVGVPHVDIFFIHGVGDAIRAKHSDLDGILGFGNPDRHTCDLWRKDALVDCLTSFGKWNIYEGKSGGKYSAWDRLNLTQAIHHKWKNYGVQCFQLEIAFAWRSSEKQAKKTGGRLANAIVAFQALSSDYKRKSKVLEA